MGIVSIREDDSGPLENPFEFDNIPPSDVEVVFECEDCNKKETDYVSNITYNGAPICCNGEEMMLSHCKVKIT